MFRSLHDYPRGCWSLTPQEFCSHRGPTRAASAHSRVLVKKDDAQRYLNGKLRERDLGIFASSSQKTTMSELFDDVLTSFPNWRKSGPETRHLHCAEKRPVEKPAHHRHTRPISRDQLRESTEVPRLEFVGAGGEGRTLMPSEGRGILSPVRLPVPPLQQPTDLFEFTADTSQPHCNASCNGSRAAII